MDKPCTTGSRILPSDAFIHKGKEYKTCSRCLAAKAERRGIKRAIPADNDVETIGLQEIGDYVAESIASLARDAPLSLDVQVELDDNALLLGGHDIQTM